jgi:hypothetical protein
MAPRKIEFNKKQFIAAAKPLPFTPGALSSFLSSRIAEKQNTMTARQ